MELKITTVWPPPNQDPVVVRVFVISVFFFLRCILLTRSPVLPCTEVLLGPRPVIFLDLFFFAVFCAAAMDDFLALCFASRSHLPVFLTAFVLSV